MCLIVGNKDLGVYKEVATESWKHAGRNHQMKLVCDCVHEILNTGKHSKRDSKLYKFNHEVTLRTADRKVQIVGRKMTATSKWRKYAQMKNYLKILTVYCNAVAWFIQLFK